MTNRKLAIIWAILYGVTAALEFLPKLSKALSFLMILLSLAFFVPPGMLIYRGVTRGDTKLLRIIRNLCFASLGGTLLLLVLNFLTYNASPAAGLVLNWLLTLVSAPMICSQLWVVPLFGWAIMLMICLDKTKKKS